MVNQSAVFVDTFCWIKSGGGGGWRNTRKGWQSEINSLKIGWTWWSLLSLLSKRSDSLNKRQAKSSVTTISQMTCGSNYQLTMNPWMMALLNTFSMAQNSEYNQTVDDWKIWIFGSFQRESGDTSGFCWFRNKFQWWRLPHSGTKWWIVLMLVLQPNQWILRYLRLEMYQCHSHGRVLQGSPIQMSPWLSET